MQSAGGRAGGEQSKEVEWQGPPFVIRDAWLAGERWAATACVCHSDVISARGPGSRPKHSGFLVSSSGWLEHKRTFWCGPPASLECTYSRLTDRHWQAQGPYSWIVLGCWSMWWTWRQLFFRFYLFLERGEGREKERERNTNVWLPLTCPQLGTWPTIQACALTGNQTSNTLVPRPALNPLSHTSQG